MAWDAAGDLFIADRENNRVREVRLDGTIVTVAGNGTAGFSGDGGPATAATLNHPYGLAVDASGNLLIADAWNNAIREVKADGTIATVAGVDRNGNPDPRSIGQPRGLAMDALGDLFIVDASYNRILEREPDGTIVTVVGASPGGFAGDGGPAATAQLHAPESVAVDPTTGNLFIADVQNGRIREVVKSTGIIVTVAGSDGKLRGDGGPATAAKLYDPRGIAVDGRGNLFIADAFDNRIREVKPDGTIVTAVGDSVAALAGDGGPAAAARLNKPEGVFLGPSGDLVIVDTGNGRIREVKPDGTIASIAGIGTGLFGGDGGPATAAQLSLPSGVAVDDRGNLFIADPLNHRVREVKPDGTITTVAGNGILGDGGDGGRATDAMLVDPIALAVDSADDLFIADYLDNRVREVTPDGTITTLVGNGVFEGDGPAVAATLYYPNALAVDSAGDVFISSDDGRVREVVKATGMLVRVAGNGSSYYRDGVPATATGIGKPTGVAVDASGNLFIAAGGNNRILEVVKATGDIVTVAGNGSAGSNGDGGPAIQAALAPTGVAVDPGGNLIIVDAYDLVIREVEKATGKITTVAGSGRSGFGGDGGPPTAAMLNRPVAVALDSSGNLFIADDLNQLVRKVSGPAIVGIAPAPLMIAVDSKGRYAGRDNPALTGTVRGIVNNDAVTVVYGTTAAAGSAPGAYTIGVVGLAGAKARDYTFDPSVTPGARVTPGVLTVYPAAPSVIGVRVVAGRGGRSDVVLAFNGPLNPARAREAHLYHLAVLNARGRVVGTIGIRSASYDDVAHAVTLHVRGRLAPSRHYRLVVRGRVPDGVTGRSGVPLNGGGGPGSDYVHTFGRKAFAAAHGAAVDAVLGALRLRRL